MSIINIELKKSYIGNNNQNNGNNGSGRNGNGKDYDYYNDDPETTTPSWLKVRNNLL